MLKTQEEYIKEAKEQQPNAANLDKPFELIFESFDCNITLLLDCIDMGFLKELDAVGCMHHP